MIFLYCYFRWFFCLNGGINWNVNILKIISFNFKPQFRYVWHTHRKINKYFKSIFIIIQKKAIKHKNPDIEKLGSSLLWSSKSCRFYMAYEHVKYLCLKVHYALKHATWFIYSATIVCCGGIARCKSLQQLPPATHSIKTMVIGKNSKLFEAMAPLHLWVLPRHNHNINSSTFYYLKTILIGDAPSHEVLPVALDIIYSKSLYYFS